MINLSELLKQVDQFKKEGFHFTFCDNYIQLDDDNLLTMLALYGKELVHEALTSYVSEILEASMRRYRNNDDHFDYLSLMKQSYDSGESIYLYEIPFTKTLGEIVRDLEKFRKDVNDPEAIYTVDHQLVNVILEQIKSSEDLLEYFNENRNYPAVYHLLNLKQKGLELIKSYYVRYDPKMNISMDKWIAKIKDQKKEVSEKFT